MMIFRLLFILVVSFDTVFSGRDAPCVTPNGENVKCVPISSCNVIIDALFTGNETVAEFVKQSQCGFDTEQLICCGSSAYPVSNIFDDLFNFPPEKSKQTTKPPTAERFSKPELEAQILANFKTNELPDRTVCGIEKKGNRIVGGELTQIDEFPWMAALEYVNKFTKQDEGIRCGGSVINNRYVLTAAHCIRHREFKLVSVRLGEWKISTDPDCQTILTNPECAHPVQKLKIKEQIPHPYYSKKSARNDIGLLRLESDIKYTDYIRPICLPPPDLPDPEFGALVTVAGWGITENDTASDVKLKVKVPLLSNEDCTAKLTDRSISADHLCAGGKKGKDSCQGDSGGPLMRAYEDTNTQQNQWYQEGIVSYGIGCGVEGFPAVYTRASRYIIWILNNIKD